MPGTPTMPRFLLCNAPFGRDVSAVRDYVAACGYDGVEWGLDNLRVAVARGRRDRMRASSSGWLSRGLWSWSPRCCSWTSPSRISMPSFG